MPGPLLLGLDCSEQPRLGQLSPLAWLQEGFAGAVPQPSGQRPCWDLLSLSVLSPSRAAQIFQALAQQLGGCGKGGAGGSAHSSCLHGPTNSSLPGSRRGGSNGKYLPLARRWESSGQSAARTNRAVWRAGCKEGLCISGRRRPAPLREHFRKDTSCLPLPPPPQLPATTKGPLTAQVTPTSAKSEPWLCGERGPASPWLSTTAEEAKGLRRAGSTVSGIIPTTRVPKGVPWKGGGSVEEGKMHKLECPTEKKKSFI